MKLKDIMTSHVHSISSDASLRQAAEEMSSLNVGALPVMEKKRIVGVITDRDITIRAIAKGNDPNKTAVRDVMTAEVASAPGDTSLDEAVKLMEEKQIRRLLVTDSQGNMQGIVSLGDIAIKWEDKLQSAEALGRISLQTANV